jgi:hypothetical protein
MADRVSQEAVEGLTSGASNARISQDAVEALKGAQARQAEVSQAAIEALKGAQARQAEVSHDVIEALVQHNPVAGGVSQVAFEVLRTAGSIIRPRARVYAYWIG